MFVRLLITTLAFCPAVLGITAFTPNCTASNETVNFVYGTGYRSTLDILWSSLFTIIACTWTVLHLNVPEQRNGRDPGIWGDLKWALKRLRKSVEWLMITIVAPECTLGLAAQRLVNAMKSRKQFKNLAAMDGIEWNLEHGFYADMGGFALKATLPLEYARIPDVTFHLTSKTLLKLREEGHIKRLPQVATEQINDQSKSDAFTKLITAVQVLSTVIQIIVRRTRKLTISQLELAVAAFSVCAVTTYLLTLYRPKGVQTVRVLYNDGKALSFEKAHQIYYGCFKDSGYRPKEKSYFLGGGIDKGVPNDYFSGEDGELFFFLAIAGTIFGAIHCFAWNFTFPTANEVLLWRIASIMTTTLPVVLLSVEYMGSNLSHLEYHFLEIIYSVIAFFYVNARLFIIVEVFRTLFYLPPDAFISTWADKIPHVS